jgi:phosphate transport system substrate-binding protein
MVKEENMMKKVFMSACIISLFLGISIQTSQAEEKEKELKGIITMSGAWALYPMAVKWAEEFQKIHPHIRIDIAAGGAGKGMADALAQLVDIGNVSRDIYPAEIEKGAWWVSVTKDAVVPTCNAKNPFIEKLLRKGVTRDTFVDIWGTGKLTTWDQVIGSDGKNAIHVYTRSDACGAAQTWAEFLGRKQEDLLGIGVYGDPGLAEAVKTDLLGIGFNNINYAYDAKTKLQVHGIRILPIDLNGNGQIDPDEYFYDHQDKIVEAIATGKYPSPPARALHFVSQGKPERKVVRAFIKWVLTDGQKYVSEAGYIKLPDDTLQEELQKIGE